MTYSNKNKMVTVSTRAIALVLMAAAIAQVPTIAHAQTSSEAFSWSSNTAENETDHRLENANIQVKYEGIIVEPRLNITANNGAVTASVDENVEFRSFWNYGAFIKQAEVRIFDNQASTQSTPLAVLPMDKSQYARLDAGTILPNNLIYVLRVYGEDGRFDETEAKPFTRLEGPAPDRVPLVNSSANIGFGIDRTARRNISIKGGSVTVYGTDLPEQSRVAVLGQSVPVDNNGSFLSQMILPFGGHNVDINVINNTEQASYDREIYLKKNDFFYVGLGDITLGTSSSVGPADFLGQQDKDFSNVSAIGRGASYIKGRIGGDYVITGSIDTKEERLRDVFSNLDEKDPRQLLRRLDADQFYPVYGDDSTLVEDAPTQGRFYLKVEKDDSHILWGNFATQITGTEFAHLDRGLYGGILDYNSKDTTRFGERRTNITGFAADPGTVPAREEFRATGGSVYFLNRQDLSIGSERVRIEIRDKVSGLVLETRDLRPQEDYDIDYIQGRILLSDPLQSTVNDNQIVRDGALSGNEVFVVARYEFTPTLSNVNGFTLGGRATHWVNDHVRVGVTGQTETTDSADQELIGFDALIRHSAGTYIKGEYAQTNGQGFAQVESTDGGFLFEDIPAQGADTGTASAYRVEGAADLSEFSNVDAQVSGYYDFQENGFSGANRINIGEVERWGASVKSDLTDQLGVSVKYDELDSDVRGSSRAIYADLSYDLNETLGVSVGVRHDDVVSAATTANPLIDGGRTDISAQLNYNYAPGLTSYVFGQTTLDQDATRQDNDRYGIGGNVQLNDRIKVTGEVSGGDGGLGANGQVNYTRSDNSEFYLGYALSPDRRDTGFETASLASLDQGTLTLGARTRFNDNLSVYGEERFGFGSSQSSQTHVYGLTFNPSETWSLGASIENGIIDDDVNGSFDRTAFSLSAARATDSFRFSTSLEGRFESGVFGGESRDRDTYLIRNTAAYDANENWELLGRFNFALSDSDESDFQDAEFVEGILAAAYRPVENDRFNALLKYTYFEDLAPTQQLSNTGISQLPRQRSQVFSVDAIYDVTKKLSVGAKYGFRQGDVTISNDRTSDDFVSSNAQLGVVRLDYHVVKSWDILAEGRVLSSSLADDMRYGALLGVYRHVGENAKIGIGYNFSNFSDDLTDFSENNSGAFINLIGKF